MITIAYTVGDQLLTVTPSKRQFAGVMGRVNECKVSFAIPSMYAASPYRVRVEYVDVSGKLFTTDEAGFSDLLTVSGSTYSLVLPWQWTAYGGVAHIRIVVYTVDKNGAIASLLKSPDCSLHFTNSQEGRDIVERRSLAQLIVDGRGLTESVGEAIADATKAAESARDAHSEAYAAASAATATARELQEMAENGEFDGNQGVPGVSPTVKVTDIEGGHRVTVTDAEGSHNFDVMDGEVVSGVASVNGKTGAVKLTAGDVGALPDTYTPPAAPVQSVNGKTGSVKLSASDVSAAPSGYGLGAQTPKITPEELNTTTNNGWYRIMSSTSFSVAGFNMTDAWLHVSRYMDTYLVQKLYPMTGNKVEIVRWCLAGTWHEEFVNPPMYAGTEYRTTERYNGAPVYTKKVTYSFSDTIGSTSGVTTIRIPHSISGFGTLVRCVGRVPSVDYVFPYLGGSGGVTVVNAVSASDIVVRLTNMTWEANTFEFDLYYTK